jgi:predicted acetyltransferase
MKENKYEVFTNCRWQDKGVGEIDIAVGIETEEKVWEICVLIECKSRLFDLREAAKQVKVEDFK